MTTEELYTANPAWKSQSIFSHLDDDELEYLEEMTEIRHYKRNEIIFSEGKYITGCYIVLSGLVKQFKTGDEGKDCIFRIANPFAVLGYRSVLSEEPACNTSSVIEDSLVCYIPKECLYHLVKTNGNFALDMLQIACRELEESHLEIARITQKTVKRLLAELLLSMKKKFGVNEHGQLNILLSREEYANILGTATESVIRLLSEFKNENYIDISGKRITILNEKALEKIV